ncbi:unnamed protein product [Cercopithifilaria johnstoni]|uniref:Uncharacterized protein n=1 Tax=Cercopithifilaria johnstoni TaxID=2874296 RepID=A0A8J2MGV6_9BILA|nr:unnamed protein product [Cercopithifilaria johnstoni]
MLLFVGIILINWIHGTCIELRSINFDLSPLQQTMAPQTKSSILPTITVKNITDSDTRPNDTDKKIVSWECGNDHFTKLVSETKVRRNCPRLRKPINQCCINHDDCYSKQLGRKYCDDVFCECLQVATKPSFICNNQGRSFCELVRFFGELAYINAGREEEKKATKITGILQRDDTPKT